MGIRDLSHVYCGFPKCVYSRMCYEVYEQEQQLNGSFQATIVSDSV